MWGKWNAGIGAVVVAVGTLCGAAAGAAPAMAVPAVVDDGGVSEVEGLPTFPGLATEFDTVTVVDGVTGEVIGSTRSVASRIGIVGPGCATTSLCLFGSPYRGYQGAGSMAVSVAGVSSYTNGSYVGQLQWKSGTALVTGPKTSGPVSISGGAVTVVKVTIF